MSHSFDPEIAGRVGVNAAVIYQNVLFWCAHNAANDKHIHEGLAWTYNSLEAFDQLFPYLTKNQIRTAIKKLESEGLLKRGNFNKAGYDRTTWYAAINPQFSAMCEKSQMDVGKSTNGCVKKHTPIPDINTDITADKNKNNKARKPDCVSEGVWSDFQSLRKAKKAPLTPTALERIESEAVKAGWSLEDALSECSARGWQGFNAEWVKEARNDNRRQGNSNRNAAELARAKLAGFSH
jgi:hypothetical protein